MALYIWVIGFFVMTFLDGLNDDDDEAYSWGMIGFNLLFWSAWPLTMPFTIFDLARKFRGWLCNA